MSVRIMKAPSKYVPYGIGEHTIFLAGGISNCSDWQNELTRYIEFGFGDKKFVILNPRRDDFDMSNERESVKQIEWEAVNLDQCDTLLFWFPKETVCPITLYELGAYTGKKKNLIVGVDPHYKRKLDVAIQTRIRSADTVPVYVGWDSFLSGVARHLRSVGFDLDSQQTSATEFG